MATPVNQAPSVAASNPLSRIETNIRDRFAALLRSCPDRITVAHIDAAAAVPSGAADTSLSRA